MTREEPGPRGTRSRRSQRGEGNRKDAHFKSDGDACWGHCVGASLLGGESGVWGPVGAGRCANGRGACKRADRAQAWRSRPA